MIKKKIIILLSQTIDERNLNRFGFYFLKKYFDVEFWDISSIFNSRISLYAKKNKINNKIDSKFFYQIHTYSKLLKNLLANKSGYFFDLTTFNSIFFSLIQKIAVLKGLIKVHLTTALVPKSIFLSKKKKLLNILNSRNLLSFLNFFFIYITNKISLFIKPHSSIAFIAGKEEIKHYKAKTKIVYSNSLDFNKYLSEKKINNKKLQKEKFILFIDTATFDHPENFYRNKKVNNALINKYYHDLKHFLSNLHMKTNLKIYISLHPRASTSQIYKNKIKKIFKDKYFKIVSGHTSIYIKNCKLVISHASSALQFAILWFKPVVFYYHKLQEEREKQYAKALAKEIKSNCYDISSNNFYNFKKIFKINKKKYKNYINKFITCDYHRKFSSWHIVKNVLN